MNPQREFISETFHALAQPLTSLRVTVELGLDKDGRPTCRAAILEDCLRLIDRLMQDLAVFREIASLGEAPPLARLRRSGLAPKLDRGDGAGRTSQRRSRSISTPSRPYCLPCPHVAAGHLRSARCDHRRHRPRPAKSRSLSAAAKMNSCLSSPRPASRAAPEAMPQAHAVGRRPRHRRRQPGFHNHVPEMLHPAFSGKLNG